MRKYIPFPVLIFLLLNIIRVNANCIDTAIVYYKYIPNGYAKVATLDNADFIRMIYSPEQGETLYNVKEFYKNGTLKLIGKISEKFVTVGGEIALDGDCVYYDRNGKRQSIIHFKDGYKDGNEYDFYPNGKIYSVRKNSVEHGVLHSALDWECYDENGRLICKEGNGRWLVYDENFKAIVLSGLIKNGKREGEWVGNRMLIDSIKTMYNYKGGLLLSARSIDKTGKVYPFKADTEPAYYWSGSFNFLKFILANLKLPKDTNREKISADDVIVSFIVEKDGHLSPPEMSADIDPRLKDAIAAAFSKSKNWTPRKNFGVPVRAKLTFSLKYIIDYVDEGFLHKIFYGEEQVGY